MTHILLADDHVLFRETIAQYLERDADIRFKVDEVDDMPSAISCLKQKNYDIVILDWHMRGLNNIDNLIRIVDDYPLQKFIVISGVVNKDMIEEINATNICGFFSKTIPGKEFVKSIKDILEGDIIKRCDPTHNMEDNDRLTAREKTVLYHLKKGQSNKDIARELNVSEVTIKKHVKHILQKYDCQTRTELMAKWIY